MTLDGDPDRPLAARRRDRKVQLGLIFMISFAMLGAAYLLYYVASTGGMWGTINHGRFVEPPVSVADLGLRDADGQAARLRGTSWRLLVVVQTACDSRCRGAVHQLRQLHALLNKDAGRVRRAIFWKTMEEDHVEVPTDTAWLARYPKLEQFYGVRGRAGDVTDVERGIYIVDPLGNLVFFYPMDVAGESVLEDLKHLLKVSQIG